MGWWWWCGGAALVCVLIARIFLAPKRDGTRERAPGSADVLVVVGSGGHTTEILRLVGSLSASYTPRHYVIADTDRMSEDKVCAFETARSKEHSEPQIPSTCSYKGTWVFTGWQQSCVTYTIHRVPRSREVRQSWTSSVVSTLHALLYSIPLVFRLKPDMVLCNGPGTCIPLCISALLLGITGMKKVLIVYIESICRVETLSLSGKILYYLSDYFFVQWPTLQEKYPKAVFLGRLV